jgi:formate dehydrogenase major subunit
VAWHAEDILKSTHDAEVRGIKDGQRKFCQPVGANAAGVDFRAHGAGCCLHDVPSSGVGANVITTENSDWATNCPEYKVTAVQVTPVQPAIGLAEGLEIREDENKRIEVKPLVAAECIEAHGTPSSWCQWTLAVVWRAGGSAGCHIVQFSALCGWEVRDGNARRS